MKHSTHSAPLGSATTDVVSDDARLVQRQAFAGIIWSKQYYYLDVPQWLRGDATQVAALYQPA